MATLQFMLVLTDKDRHKRCLLKINGQKEDGSLPTTEAEVAYALAVHLFAPLSHNGCVLDSRSSPKSCPGGCGKTAEKGPTGIGKHIILPVNNQEIK